MKYYESTYLEYINSKKRCDIHPELDSFMHSLSPDIRKFKNIILYGPSGSGKYTQALSIIEKFSSTGLHYDKKIMITNEKNEKKKEVRNESSSKKSSISKKVDFIYKISDIHYEVDMALLGCNSKTLWNDIFFQIIDIISVKSNKSGIILCKNMHCIYNELLDVFNSYINFLFYRYDIHLYFILLTEHIGFLPQNIAQKFDVIHVKRPSTDAYYEILQKNKLNLIGQHHHHHNSGHQEELLIRRFDENLKYFGHVCVTNLKEIHTLKRETEQIPKDVFNIVVDEIILKMRNPTNIDVIDFRNNLYDMLIYNLDIFECVYHILIYFIINFRLPQHDVQAILYKTFSFFQYYNNNYRPIYHLESLLYYIINKLNPQNTNKHLIIDVCK